MCPHKVRHHRLHHRCCLLLACLLGVTVDACGRQPYSTGCLQPLCGLHTQGQTSSLITMAVGVFGSSCCQESGVCSSVHISGDRRNQGTRGLDGNCVNQLVCRQVAMLCP